MQRSAFRNSLEQVLNNLLVCHVRSVPSKFSYFKSLYSSHMSLTTTFLHNFQEVLDTLFFVAHRMPAGIPKEPIPARRTVIAEMTATRYAPVNNTTITKARMRIMGVQPSLFRWSSSRTCAASVFRRLHATIKRRANSIVPAGRVNLVHGDPRGIKFRACPRPCATDC